MMMIQRRPWSLISIDLIAGLSFYFFSPNASYNEGTKSNSSIYCVSLLTQQNMGI